MKIFNIIKRQYATLGVSPSNQWTQKHPFNGKVSFGFSLFAYLFLSQLMYIFHVANNFMEYMVSICSVSAGTIIFLCFAAIVFRKTKLFACIDSMEKVLETSESFKLIIPKFHWQVLMSVVNKNTV